MANFVYELEKGWSFDGYYIPHFLELNYYFGEDPVTYKTVQKIRVHGLAKGRSYLQVRTKGLETDYEETYSPPEYLDLPKIPKFVSSGFAPVTSYVDSANHGIALQMRFEGRNTDITLPEPAHVLQVLVPQSSPAGTGARAN